MIDGFPGERPDGRVTRLHISTGPDGARRRHVEVMPQGYRPGMSELDIANLRYDEMHGIDGAITSSGHRIDRGESLQNLLDRNEGRSSAQQRGREFGQNMTALLTALSNHQSPYDKRS